MKILNDKSGFTLIELLAVIVVLAIVAVLGYSTVLPLLADSRKNAFATEANGVIDAAQNAMTLIQIDKADKEFVHFTKKGDDTVYCFTLQDLVNLSMLKKSLTNGDGDSIYEGIVAVTIPKGSGAFKYYLSMQNDSYSVSTDTGNVDSKIVKDVEEIQATTSCNDIIKGSGN